MEKLKKTKPDEEYNQEELKMGIEIEMEHTTDKKLAKKIAKHHLDEFPNYYTELSKMEEKLKKKYDAKRGKYANCKRMLIFQGYTEHEAETACAKWLDSEDKPDEFNTLFIDEEDALDRKKGESDQACLSRKMHIISKEHPEWSHKKRVAVSHSYCGLSRDMEDAIDLSNVIARSRSLSLSRFATLIKNIKIKVGLKVGAMGILPQKVEMPMKNLNRLQTKLEKFITAEQSWLTSEEFLQRAQYARYMRKTDADEEFDEDYEMSDEEFTDSITKLYNEIVEYYPLNTPEEAIDRAFELSEGDNAWIMSNEAEILSMNDGLNNIIKAPIILAREMVQRYTTEKGVVEYHFKPYHELKRAAERASISDQLDIIIEHQDWYDSDNIMGYVKEIRADDKSRSIKGTCYFYESKLPDGLKQMIKDGEIIPVSIGFLAKLGKGGTFNNQEYKHTQEHIVLRHLAIILDSVARCPAGVCGINLVDSKNEEKINNVKNFIIIKKENYYLNYRLLFKKVLCL